MSNASEKLNRKLGFQNELHKIMCSDTYCNKAKIAAQDARHLQRGEWTVVMHKVRFRARTLTALARKVDKHVKENGLEVARMF